MRDNKPRTGENPNYVLCWGDSCKAMRAKLDSVA